MLQCLEAPNAQVDAATSPKLPQQQQTGDAAGLTPAHTFHTSWTHLQQGDSPVAAAGALGRSGHVQGSDGKAAGSGAGGFMGFSLSSAMATTPSPLQASNAARLNQQQQQQGGKSVGYKPPGEDLATKPGPGSKTGRARARRGSRYRQGGWRWRLSQLRLSEKSDSRLRTFYGVLSSILVKCHRQRAGTLCPCAAPPHVQHTHHTVRCCTSPCAGRSSLIAWTQTRPASPLAAPCRAVLRR